ncbi:gephyrin [Palaemon carinicauda]|uniref:gephyrin n=1 Tax=Palaemon carinicauda TaxID=392227 RepID=UPI0035B6043C
MSNMITVGVLTVSDRCSKGEAVDESGANLVALINSFQIFQGKVSKTGCVPDEAQLIKEKILEWCLEDLNLIITTGGTGFAPRDVTPEAVKEVIEKEAPGLATLMITESLRVTPLAVLSRPVCGIRGKTLIVTLPGSKKASEECLRFIAPSIPHAVDLLLEHTTNVKETHSELQGRGVFTRHHHDNLHSHGHHHHSHHHHGHHQRTQHHKSHHHHHYHSSSSGSSESKADVSQVCRRPRKSPYHLISVEEAIEIIIKNSWQCGPKTVGMAESLGYILAEDIKANDPLPPFPASIKDGYAIVASDGAGLRKVLGSSTAGCKPEEFSLKSGECIRINTGAPVPPGADAVIQVEDTVLTKEADDGRTEIEIEILKTPEVGQDIRPIGSDIAANEVILTTGTLLGPSEVGLLATVGVTEVLVIAKPIVAVMSTGNELQEPGEPLKEGHIRDSNKTTLIALLKQHNFPFIDAGIARDEPTELLNILKTALSEADILVTTGGVSMGERDILRPVLQSDFGVDIHFAQVYMKPGKPTTFATCTYKGQKKLILGLPGNPVSAVVTSNLYLLPLCRKMSGWTNYMYTVIKAKLSAPVHLDPRPEYHRATLCWKPGDEFPTAHSTGNQISSRLLSLVSAQALLRLPNRTEELKSLPQNSLVDAIILRL